MTRTTLLASVLLSVWFLWYHLLFLVSAQQPPEGAGFPLDKGTVWVYEGPVMWTPSGSASVEQDTLSWNMEIIDNVQRQHVLAALIKGHPLDLAWYEEGKTEPAERLIIRVGEDRYYLLSGDRAREALVRLRDEQDVLVDLVKDYELFLELPLAPGKIYGEAFQLTRQDSSYFWNVLGEERIVFDHVKGLSPESEMTQYEISLTTLSDHQRVYFVPGLGISRYIYGHHGSTSEMDLRLVMYQSGG